MQTKIDKDDKRLKMEVEDEDVSLAHIVRGELLKAPDTAFAGVVKPHPLLKKFVIALETKRRDPVATLIEGGKMAVQQSKELEDQVKSSTKSTS